MDPVYISFSWIKKYHTWRFKYVTLLLMICRGKTTKVVFGENEWHVYLEFFLILRGHLTTVE